MPLPCHDASLDAVAITQCAARRGRVLDVEDDPHPLLLDAERRDLQESRGLHAADQRVERLASAPLIDQRPHARLDLHGVGGEEVRDHLE